MQGLSPYPHQHLSSSGDQEGVRIDRTDDLARIEAIAPAADEDPSSAIFMNIESAATRILNGDASNILLHNNFPA